LDCERIFNFIVRLAKSVIKGTLCHGREFLLDFLNLSGVKDGLEVPAEVRAPKPSDSQSDEMTNQPQQPPI